VLLARGPVLSAADLPLSHAMPAAGLPGSRATLEELERRHIEAVLAHHDWHQGHAAEALGISAKTLYRKIREYGLKRPSRA
jgi:two-component system NtrC family response regulator